jgi:small subunit ribosomal protein S21
LQVFVRDNNVDQALRVLKKKMQRKGVFRHMKQRAPMKRHRSGRCVKRPATDALMDEVADALIRYQRIKEKDRRRAGAAIAPLVEQCVRRDSDRPDFHDCEAVMLDFVIIQQALLVRVSPVLGKRAACNHLRRV